MGGFMVQGWVGLQGGLREAIGVDGMRLGWVE